MTTGLARSAEFKRLTGAGSTVARLMERSGVGGAPAGLARLDELRRLSGASSTVARSLDASRTVGATTGLARSAEFKRLTGAGSTVARLMERSGVSGAPAGLARLDELRRLSGASSTVARSLNASRTVGATTGLARSAEFKRLTGVGSTVARLMERSGVGGAPAGLARLDELRRLSGVGSTVVRSLGALRVDRGTAAFARSETEEPFPRPVAELVGHEFSDVDTDQQRDSSNQRDEIIVLGGPDSGLTEVPRASFDTVLFGTGLKLSLASVPVPKAIKSPDAGTAFKSEHWQIFCELEQRPRQVVELQLEKLAGSNWVKRRVPQPVRERWMNRQEEDRADGRPVYPAIQYADFMDLADVIVRRDNWYGAFQTIFRDQHDIAVSLRRLHSVRKALAHSRPLGRADVLTLVSEAVRIFHALGIRILH